MTAASREARGTVPEVFHVPRQVVASFTQVALGCLVAWWFPAVHFTQQSSFEHVRPAQVGVLNWWFGDSNP